MKKLLVILLIMLLSITFVACSSDKKSSDGNIDSNNYFGSNNDTEQTNSKEDSLSGIWSVVEGGDDHSIVIANGNIQIIDGNDSVICKYTKPSENVFKFEFDGETWELKYSNGLLYRYENGELDGYVYERTAYNSIK